MSVSKDNAVNQQHLRAMGLDPELLGKPYAAENEKAEIADRCESLNEDFQCARPKGHGGIHLRGHRRWNDYDVEEQE